SVVQTHAFGIGLPSSSRTTPHTESPRVATRRTPVAPASIGVFDASTHPWFSPPQDATTMRYAPGASPDTLNFPAPSVYAEYESASGTPAGWISSATDESGL